MLSKKITTLILFFLMLLSYKLEANYKIIDGVMYSLNEFALLNVPQNNSKDWKEIVRNTKLTEGMVEWIPCNQTKDNFSEIIAIQYYEKSILDENMRNLDKAIEKIRKVALSAFPSNKVSFKILEKNQNDILYEVLHQEYKDSPKEHEISRILFTKRGFHRVGISQRYSEINSIKREECIKNLKEISIVTSNEAAESEGFSLVDKIKDSLDIGTKFSEWTLIDIFAFSNGGYLVKRTPPGHNLGAISEILEIFTMPLYGLTIDQSFVAQKKKHEERFLEKIEFNVLTKSQTESISNFSVKVDQNIINFIEKIIVLKHGYYCITYKIALPEKLTDDVILYWKQQLDNVKVKTNR